MKGEKQNKEPATKARKHQIYENNFSNFSAHKKHTSVYHQKKKKKLAIFYALFTHFTTDGTVTN